MSIATIPVSSMREIYFAELARVKDEYDAENLSAWKAFEPTFRQHLFGSDPTNYSSLKEEWLFRRDRAERLYHLQVSAITDQYLRKTGQSLYFS